MMKRMAFGLLAICLLTGGCARLNSIYRTKDIDKGGTAKVLLIDAKQRAILTSERPVRQEGGTYIATYRAFCAEPSPDVFTVLSQAASLSGSFGQDTTSINAALQAAMSSAESGATIPRTQTLNMLREMMYRTCERYMSGALDESQFAIQAIRDQHTMVSILAIEQLTGAVTPPRVTLAAGSAAGAGSSSEALVRLDDAWKAKTAAARTLAEKNAAKDALDGTDSGLKSSKKCKDLTADASDEDDKAKFAKCAAADKDINAASDAKKIADDHYNELKALAGGGGASTSAAPVALAQPNDAIQRAEQVKDVATAVQDIVRMNFDQDEVVLFCLREMKNGGPVQTACLEYITAKVGKETATLNTEIEHQKFLAAQTQREMLAIGDRTTVLFGAFWKKVASESDSDVPDPKRLADVVGAVAKNAHAPSTKAGLEKLKNAKTRSDAIAIFGRLVYAVQKKLSD